MVTDGRDGNAKSNGPGSTHPWDDVLSQLEKTDATVYAIGIGTKVDRPRLEALAKRSGGAAYFQADTSTLSASYQKIVDERRRRYVIGYESSSSRRAGAWRAVQIRTRDGAAVVRSRGGYFAPPADAVATR